MKKGASSQRLAKRNRSTARSIMAGPARGLMEPGRGSPDPRPGLCQAATTPTPIGQLTPVPAKPQ